MQGLTYAALLALSDSEQLLSERIAIICEGEKCGEDEAREIAVRKCTFGNSDACTRVQFKRDPEMCDRHAYDRELDKRQVRQSTSNSSDYYQSQMVDEAKKQTRIMEDQRIDNFIHSR